MTAVYLRVSHPKCVTKSQRLQILPNLSDFCNRSKSSHLAGLGETRNPARLVVWSAAKLWALTLPLLNTLVKLTALPLILARVCDTASISKVRVNTTKRASILGNNTIDHNVTRATVVGAVAAGADQLAVGVDVKVFDVQRALAVELEDFVGGLHGAAADDVGCSGGLEEGGGVFADVFPPDVLDGTE